MRTVISEPKPAEFEALLKRRRRLGQDLLDEVWEGEYHVNPAPHPWHGQVEDQLAVLLAPLARAAGLIGTGIFNLGSADDYRVPDRGYHREPPGTVFVPTAALVVEVVSPGDESFAKFDFYARHGVEEILTADPHEGRVRVWQRAGDGYDEARRSAVLDVSADDLSSDIDWPR